MSTPFIDIDINSIDLAGSIDHTLLTATATLQQVDEWCQQADRYGFASVCVHPNHVRRAVERLHGTRIPVSTVVGFPLGTALPQVKLLEAQLAVEQGAMELDIRIDLGWVLMGQWDPLHAEIAQIVEATQVPVKAILETSLLTEDQQQSAAEVCVEAGVAFLKTSTGWFGGATVADVRRLWQVTQGRVGVKASGGIRTVEQAIELLQAGATRLGTSRGVELMQQLKA